MKLWAIVVAGLTLAGCAYGAPIVAQQVQPAPVNVERLMTDVRALSADEMEGRGFGQPGGDRARDYVVAAFEAAGLEPLASGWLKPFTARGTAGENVVGVVRGSVNPDQWIVVTAHYDHEGIQNGQIYNGADDNASGTAALIELARLLRDHPPRQSVMFVALDGEEAGLLGARAFVADSPVPLDRVVLNINLDMVSRGDNGILWVVGTRLYPALIPVIEGLPQQPGIERRFGYDDPAVRGRNNWVNLSDQAAFHARGVPFVFFSVDDHGDYHQPSDDAERIDAAWYRGAVQTAWETLMAVDRMDNPQFRGSPVGVPATTKP
ncbi:M28 family peptidase [Brevundimonas aveniformis]|uniref:M28 family peptidase n=1 Tax=Brevundimonas aveniformis TaxID=370977 RepID=UPI00041AD82F|nr:M28 family peptidase [Brevundimonas aveniformis]